MSTQKLFGLNENTGLEDEITEVAGKVPSEEDKVNSTKISLRSYLNLNIIDSFTDIDENDDEEIYKRIDEIVMLGRRNSLSWKRRGNV